jgi:hypothetical protein
MFKIIYPKFDATVYSRYPEKNTGMDQILELGKQASGEPVIDGDDTVYYDKTYNSRIFLKFDLSAISGSIANGKINAASAKYYLNLTATDANTLPIEYDVYAYPLSGSWKNGTGYYNNDPIVTNGVSWYYRSGKGIADRWPTGSYNANVTGSYNLVNGGGNWYTSSFATQSFFKQLPDVRMDITPIVGKWLSGSIANDGLVVKFPDSIEQDSSIIGNIQFFSVESHTIYLPKLEIYWDSLDISGTGSYNEVTGEDFITHGKNLKTFYNTNEIANVRFFVRERYPTLTYSTSSYVTHAKRLPVSTWFQIMDVVTDTVVVPFDTIGTRVNCDTLGNYLKIDCQSLMPERKYKIILKCEFDNGDTVRYIDENLVFGIKR